MKAASKKQIQEWLDELAGIESKADKLTARYQKECAPAQVAYDEATAEPSKKFQDAIAPLNERAKELRAQIGDAILAKTDAAGDPTIRKVQGELGLVAEATVSEKREVPPQEFFKKYQKKPGFWDVITIAIGKAEKLIGKTELDAIASKVRSWKVDFRKAD